MGLKLHPICIPYVILFRTASQSTGAALRCPLEARLATGAALPSALPHRGKRERAVSLGVTGLLLALLHPRNPSTDLRAIKETPSVRPKAFPAAWLGAGCSSPLGQSSTISSMYLIMSFAFQLVSSECKKVAFATRIQRETQCTPSVCFLACTTRASRSTLHEFTLLTFL